MLLFALGLLLLSSLGLDGGPVGLLASLAMVSLGVGLVTAPLTVAALTGASECEAGTAAGVLNTSRMVGVTLGIALMGALVAVRWPGGFAVEAGRPVLSLTGSRCPSVSTQVPPSRRLCCPLRRCPPVRRDGRRTRTTEPTAVTEPKA
jgi:hypothetical protein